DPDALPVHDAVLGVMPHHARERLSAYTEAEALCDQHQEALRLAADLAWRGAIDIQRTGDEEEVVADAVQEHTGERHGVVLGSRGKREERVAGDPGEHAYCEHPLHT